MKSLITVLIALLCLPSSLYANQLTNHPSPYLALHGNDPVDWMPWSEEAIDKAQKENKLLFISVGYFSCHWCHVMQRDSYSNKEIAAKLNKHFVSVKVDRELNPVLDKKLMTFLQSTTGRGGWPMNIMLTPEGYPIVGITYMPSAQFGQLIDRLVEQWGKDREKLTAAASEVDGLIAAQLNRSQNIVEKVKPDELVNQFINQTMSTADELLGGFGTRNKFPSAPQLQTLMAITAKEKNEEVSDFLQLTLKTMALSGLNDAVGDGFYRYTMDPNWQRPHFEKMLYTSAQLTPIYITAWKRWGDTLYKETAMRTLDFMSREMQGSRGGLIASLSAVDNKNIEGGYYLWSMDELEKTLTADQVKLAISLWGVDHPSEYDQGNFPVWQTSVKELAVVLGVSKDTLSSRVDVIRRTLLSYRNNNRVLPRDDKMLASWNGLALAAFADGLALDKKYNKQGSAIAGFITSLWDGKTLTKAMDKNGREFGAGTLPDYAGSAYGLIKWGVASHDENSIKAGEEIISAAWNKFHTSKGWLEKENSLLPNPLYKLHIMGGSEPSSEALLLAATRLATNNNPSEKFKNNVDRVLKTMTSEVESSPYYYASLVELYLNEPL